MNNTNSIITIPIKIKVTTSVYHSCFELVDCIGNSHKIANFYLDNFQRWIKQSGLDNVRVRCIPKSDTIWEIVDERIPTEFYNNYYCGSCIPVS